MRFLDDDPDVDALYADLSEAELQPLWRQVGLLPHSPRTISPYLWRWKTLQTLSERAGQLISINRGGDRRVLALSHPDLDGKPFATPTLWAGIQYLNGHESAPPHRHTPAALRFVLSGSGVWTLVNGDPVLMEPGDLVLTPSLNWHAHDNPGDEPMIWFDGLDLPMIQSLDAVFLEDGPDTLDAYPPRGRSISEDRFGAAGLKPTSVATSSALPEISDSGGHSPLLAYRWSATDTALTQILDVGSDVAVLRYIDPTTGSDVMPSLRAEMVRIRAGAAAPAHRKVGSSVCVVHRGAGTSTVGDTEFSWSRGDVFVVPSWSKVVHRAAANDEAADLFVLSDTPVLEKLGLARVEAL